MGCVSSKLLKKDLKQELMFGNGDLPNHVVSLTSSTYGVLKLEQDQQTHHQIKTPKQVGDQKKEVGDGKVGVFGSKRSPPREELEVINAWELMGDLEDGMPISNHSKKSPKLMGFRGGYLEKSPFKKVDSPKNGRNLGGKENNNKMGRLECYSTPRAVLKSWNFTNSSKSHRKAISLDSPRKSTSGVLTSRRRSLSPLFDPKLIDSIEQELSQEEEQIKKMVSSEKPKTQTPKSRYSIRNPCSLLSVIDKFEEKCPPGGENAVVIYTTTLRGIRKTFEDCNAVRSVMESYHIRLIERDVSMDAGFKEELRKLMGTKEVKVPLVFVKGRLIGGADQVVKLEEEGKLGGLFEGIPKAMAICDGCGGIRFIMCMDCNGSRKVLDENMNEMVRCGECNENGLVQCPICC